jgi:hypothetical protein
VVGGAKNLKLDKNAYKIDGYLAKGINKVAIAKLLDASPNTLVLRRRSFIRRRALSDAGHELRCQAPHRLSLRTGTW